MNWPRPLGPAQWPEPGQPPAVALALSSELHVGSSEPQKSFRNQRLPVVLSHRPVHFPLRPRLIAPSLQSAWAGWAVTFQGCDCFSGRCCWHWGWAVLCPGHCRPPGSPGPGPQVPATSSSQMTLRGPCSAWGCKGAVAPATWWGSTAFTPWEGSATFMGGGSGGLQ